MATFQQLAAQQKETGKNIETIIRNYKKDPAARKDVDYYRERLRRIDEEWSKFETTDNKMRLIENLPVEHEYFIKDYYTAIMDIVQQYKDVFEAAMLQAAQSPSKAQGDTGTQQDKGGREDQYKEINEQAQQQVLNEFVKLLRRQGAIISSLKRLLVQDDFSREEIPVAKKLWENVETIHFQLHEMYNNPVEHGYNLEQYVSLEKALRTILKTTANKSAQENVRGINIQAETIPIPKITIPKFDGNHLKWQEFHDLFTSLIICQPISKVQKIWYLKTHLIGEASNLIKHFAATEENFDAAWEVVVDRYNNRRLLVSKLIQELVDTPKNAASDNFKSLHDKTHECLLALQNLKIDTSTWDPLLLHMLLKKLDQPTRLRYEQALSKPREIPTIKEFLEFLERHFQSMETIAIKPSNSTSKTCTSATSENQEDGSCKMCQNGHHPLFYCKKFLQSTVPDRLKFAQKQKLCVNCLKPGHSSKQCTYKTCKKCSKKHNTLLHLEANSTTNNRGTTATSPNNIKTSNDATLKPSPTSTTSCRAEGPEVTSLTSTNHQGKRSYIILGTALVKIKANNNEIECRAVLDSGSQVNFVTERLIKRIGVSTKPSTVHINGIGSSNTKAHRRVNIALHSRINGFSTRLEASVLPHIITEQPSQFIDVESWKIPKNIKLADPKFNCPDKIDILLGAEFTHQLLAIGQIKLSDNLPILQNTLFGWVISGKIDEKQHTSITCGISTENEQGLETAITQLWKLDEVESTEKPLTTAEKLCEMHFTQHTFKNSKGRFVVRLPFCENTEELGDSHGIALNRFLSLERRLSKNPELRTLYVKFMDEYEAMGHMTRVHSNSVLTPNYFIPHHCVLRPDSKTTKLRVVFDASAKTSSGLSLNDIMYSGPTIQSELFSILLRFRLPRFVFTTDIEKMYRQIEVHNEDRKFQLIIWRNDPSAPLQYYQLNTVTYGTRSAPYLATKCLQQIAKDNIVRYPLAAQFLEDNFYVDDGLGGSDSLAKTIHIQQELIHVLKKNGFNLRKWCANHPQLLQNIPEGDQEVDLDFSKDDNKSIKALGLTWLPKDDKLRVRVNIEPCKRVTKRTVTSDLAKLYDPLGILSPILVTAKIFIQELWELKLDWDEALPASLHTKWLNFRNSLTSLEKLQISRHIFAGGIPDSVQLHIFTDASERAYGAAAYLRSTFKNGTVMVRLLCAKSRIAPLKRQTLPRLELCAAELGAMLATRIRTDLKISDNPVWFWTDSEIVLAWINASSSSFQTFVANRIARIQNSTLMEQWRHVGSKFNPADILSRGVAPETLQNQSLWFYGPSFLHGNETLWPPKYSVELAIQTNLEKKKKMSSALPLTCDPHAFVYNINHKNSFTRLQRIVAYVLRFINNTRGKKHTQDVLAPIELEEGLKPIIKAMQASEYSDEIHQLKKYKELKESSSLCNLSPFLDENDILRVGGRLDASELTYDAKHQMLIPYNDPISKLIFEMYHKQNKHCGPQTLLGMVRQRFWPIKGKLMARATVHRCIRCNRAKPVLLKQIMGNLPSTRITPARPFLHSGVDYAGPIWVHYKIRGKRPHKAYVAVFCCFTTKAIHMELVTDLTTEAFIGALRRFISRRGHCQNIYCDNATNFVGARNQLKELHNIIYSSEANKAIISECSNKGINFKFIPPRAPHFGGLWEAAVKSAKYHLLRSLGNASLTYEELETLMIEIEAVLNSRPISPLSNDPNDVAALTPGHFLVGGPLTAQIDASARFPNQSLSAKWKLVNQIKKDFWKRWLRDYLNELQGRSKWNKRSPNLEIGSIVIIKEDDTAVMEWPLGRVVKTYKGPDGAVRVADIKTATKVVKRSIDRLAPLPVSNSSDEVGESEENSEEKGDQGQIHIMDTEVNNPPCKRRRLKTNLAHIAIIAILLLPLVIGKTINITKLENKPGIHFEEVGQIKLGVTNWKFIVYFDLEPFRRDIGILKTGINELKNMCDTTGNIPPCAILINHLQQIEQEMESEFGLLSRRKKRGAVDIIGNVANSLFGVLDSNYEEQMSKTINHIQNNEAHLIKLLKNQTSFIDSTINIIKRDQVNVKTKFNEIDNRLNQITEELGHGATSKLQATQTIISHSMQLLVLSSNLQQVRSSILDVLIDSHHGKVSPLLLTPNQFLEEMGKIKIHLPSYLQLPTTQENILEFYKLMEIDGLVANNHIIFNINLPLIDQRTFHLYYLTPIPAIIHNAMTSIKLTTSWLAINDHQEEFFGMTEEKIKLCQKPHDNIFLCSNVQSTMHRGSKSYNCELNLFNAEPDSTCVLQSTTEEVVWNQLNDKNKWIYAIKGSLRLTTVCNDERDVISLNGTGILEIGAECTLKGNDITIHGHQFMTSTIRKGYTSIGTLSQNVSIGKRFTELTPLHAYATKIDELTRIQEELQKHQVFDLPSKVDTSITHSLLISYGSLGLIVCIILILSIKFWLSKRKVSSIPPPKPKRASSFTVSPL